MELIRPSVEIIPCEINGDEILKQIEKIGRVCYKSEDKITDNSAQTFVKKIINSGHHSVIEHINISVKFIIDRGISHELVRHRIGSYSQESTRYCSYDKHVKFIIPCWLDLQPGIYEIPEVMEIKSEEEQNWAYMIHNAERNYHILLEKFHWKPGFARSVLPNALKTEIVSTFNLREWRHVLNLRCAESAHEQINEVMFQLLDIFNINIPVVFEDLYQKYKKN